jgi:diacylglycerol kinase (ATP)
MDTKLKSSFIMREKTGHKKLSPRSGMKSFHYAFAGIAYFFKSEFNALLHLLATAAVVILALVFSLSSTEAILLTLAIGFVWVAELFNTAIEKMMDYISKDYHPVIRRVKDMAAAAVLLAAITALVTGCLIFIPKC